MKYLSYVFFTKLNVISKNKIILDYTIISLKIKYYVKMTFHFFYYNVKLLKKIVTF